MYLLSVIAPIYHIKFIYQNFVVGFLGIAGLIMTLSGVYAFNRLNTTVDPRYPKKASELVIIGVYKYSRNPMYLGFLLLICSIAMYIGVISSVFVIIAFVLFINEYQIKPEEIALYEKFGENYKNYSQEVRRWI
jgi:protein-S-isoprenylcysteine O-methyltransferase Ste14